MRNKILSFTIASILGFSGCASSYQPNSFTGGYSETQLAENIFNVTFNGNGYTSRQRTSDFTLLRSAEITVNNGYKYFIISNSEQLTKNSSYTTATTYNTNIQMNTYGNQTYGNAHTTSNGGQTIQISKPSTNNTIVCFKEKPEINSIVYEAEFIIKSIKTKYEMK